MTSGKFIDLTGEVFNYWTVLSYAGDGKWLCKCKCGNIKKVRSDSLKNGRSSSCGCKPKKTNFINLTGKKFDRWQVIKKVGTNKFRDILWLCRCECGTERIVKSGSLISGKSKSCGCLHKELSSQLKTNLKHGKWNTRIYTIYHSMIDRCNNKNLECYKDYGGRGIKVCDEWKNDFMSFYNWSMQNGYKDNLSIDRIDVNGNYEPSNCKWATKKEQAINRRTTKFITYNDETHCIFEWAEKIGINKKTFWNRIKNGWSIERAINTPVRSKYIRKI